MNRMPSERIFQSRDPYLVSEASGHWRSMSSSLVLERQFVLVVGVLSDLAILKPTAAQGFS